MKSQSVRKKECFKSLYLFFLIIRLIVLINLIFAFSLLPITKKGIGIKLNEFHLMNLGLILLIINLYCAKNYW